MKGIVFTELCEMVEKEFGVETLNNIVENADLSTGGVYSAVGTYDSADLFKMVSIFQNKLELKQINSFMHTEGISLKP